MKYNDLFDTKALRLMALAKRDAISGSKPAITCFMVAKVIISNEKDSARSIFNEMNLDMNRYYQMANDRIAQMPSVSDPTPYVDEELDSVVRQSARQGSKDGALAGSVTAESMLRGIIQRNSDEYYEYIQNQNNNAGSTSQSNNLLNRYSTDWTELGSAGSLTPVIGREEELLSIQRSLLCKTKNNPVLTGDAGTGKTAIVEGLAVKIAQGDVHPNLRSKKILALDAISLLEGTGVGGFKEAITIASQSDDIILFIDEIHSLPHETLDILKPFMARGNLKLIGATTAEEYSQIIDSHKAFARRLQRIDVPELSEAATLHILENTRSAYECHHGVRIGDDALKAAVSLSQRYISNRYQPDKSIDLVDEAAAKVRMSGQPGPVCEDDIREVLSKKTGIPVEKIGTDEISRLIDIEEKLGDEVLGQEEAVSLVSKAIRRNGMGLSDPNRPAASFMFAGPSGVGKTALAQSLSKNLMGTPNALLRIDMSEYQQPHTVSRLIGSPPGYVGYQSGGQLTETVSRRPYSVILFDEIEKAHPTVFELFLQVLDYGRLTDGRGRVVDFTNTMIIFTSNLDSKESITNFFTPEFLNRLDGIVKFNRLEKPVLLRIAKKMLSELSDDFSEKGYNIAFDDTVVQYVLGIDTDYGQGARPIRRVIEQRVTDAIVPLILSGTIVKGRQVKVSVLEGRLQIQ